jgi:Flp pilus assembly protein TadD
LGLAYQDASDLDGALEALSRARQLALDDPDITYNLALLQRDRGDTEAARRLVAEYLKLEPDEAERDKVWADPTLTDILP